MLALVRTPALGAVEMPGRTTLIVGGLVAAAGVLYLATREKKRPKKRSRRVELYRGPGDRRYVDVSF